MFPFYYGCLPDSKTAFVCLLAQVFLVVVNFESNNVEFNGKWTKKQNISKKAPFYGPSVNLRPLYNSNRAKVSV